jgi:7-cyano-7-deazaguanine synthase in queuosine biosynthesis
MTRVLVQCDTAHLPDQIAQEYLDARKLFINRLGAGSQDVSLRLQEFSDPLNGTLQGKELDLARIAAYVYAADQLVSRGGEKDSFGDDWRREFMVCLPVSDPEFWNSQPIHDKLQQVLGFISEDLWSFCFNRSRAPEQLPLETDERAVRNDPDCVVLFSGGADSLCAAVEEVALNGNHPVLVSHRPNSTINHTQKFLVGQLRQEFPGWFFPHSSFVVNRVMSVERDNIQRTRSFLFAALGAGVASALSLTRVVLADNGIVSLNLPFNDQEVGAIASRSTHPKFLSFFNKLTAEVLPSQPRLTNPLWSRTRAECLEVLKTTSTQRLLQLTNSCAHRSRLPSTTPHCGPCSQCIDRRLASIAAEMEDFDLPDRYQTDIFRSRLEGNGLTMAESYVRFALKIFGMSHEALFIEYPQLGDCILPEDPVPSKTAEALGAMVIRHASSTVATLRNKLSWQLTISCPLPFLRPAWSSLP